MDKTLTPRCAQRPEPEVQYGYYASRHSRSLDFGTFEGCDEEPGEPQPNLYLETYNAYCEMEDCPATSRGRLCHRGSVSEQHSASYNASVDVEDDPVVICIDNDDSEQYSSPEYDFDCQIEGPSGPDEYPQKLDLCPQLFPNRCPRLDTVADRQKKNSLTTNPHSSVACSSRSYRESLNLSKELNKPKAEPSKWDIPKTAYQNLTSKKAIINRPAVAVSTAAITQSKQFSLSSEPALPPRDKDNDSDNGSVIMEDVSSPERCIDERRRSNYGPNCKMDDAFDHNKCPEGNYKLDVDSQPLCKSRCSRQDTVVARNEKKLQPSFSSSVARSLNSYKQLNSPKSEASIAKASNEPLASKQARNKCTALAASSAASTQCKQSSPDCDVTLPSKNESAKLHLHKAVNNDSCACSTGSVQPGLATRGYSPLFFTDITRTVSPPHLTYSKPTCHSPSVGRDDSTARSNSISQPQGPVSSLWNADEIDETLIISSTPSEDEIEFDEADVDIYKDLDIDEAPADSSPPNTPVCEREPTSSMLQARTDDIAERSEELDTTLVAPADAATDHAYKSNASRSSPSPAKSADVLDIHLDAEDRTFTTPSPLLMEITRSSVSGDPNSPVIPTKSTPTLPSELRCAAVLPEDPQRTSATGLQSSTLATTSTPRTNRDSMPSPVHSAAPSPTHSGTHSLAERSPKSVNQSPSLLRATLVKNSKTESSASLVDHTKGQMTNFLDGYKIGSSPEILQDDPEVPTIDLLEEGEVLSSPANSPTASRDSTPSPRHSGTGSLAQRSPKLVDQSPNLLRATLVKNSKTHSSAGLATHSKVHVTNFLDEYEGGSSPGSLQGDAEALTIDYLEDGEVSSSLPNSPSANRDTTPSPALSAASSRRHSGTGSPARRFPKSMDQSPNLLRAALEKNLKTENCAKRTAHSKVHVTNFLDEYEGGSSPGSPQGDPEVLATALLEGNEVLGSTSHTSGSEDLRARINAVRGLPNCQFEEKLSHGQNIEDVYPPLGHITTIDALCLEARQSGTSSEAPEVKIGIPFLSEDPAENLDNDNPAWEALRQLTTEEERYQHVHKVWRSAHVPDPHQELTTFHYRRRVAGLRSKVDTLAVKRGKRRAPHEPLPSEGVGPTKRQRFDTDIFDLKLKELERKKARDFTEAKDNLRRNLDRLHRDIRRNEERHASSHSHQRHYHHNDGRLQRHHHRSETAPSDYHYWRMQERQIHEEFEASAQCINDKFSVKERQLLTARDEVHRFDAFYVGLHEDFDPRCLSESQLKQQLEAEKALGLFRLYYSPAQD
ncbi:hypothetical protein HPB48_010795 [Haemaphysalis longicornis]|uniref:Uncharacterized protein n=1 Tax=Haemaphysalis longicornis TaxID=44386 RepID=A0A9J6H1D0_HAELO|nr:hypothetical protein HPB48_010795 [Haemaphysalis longicornis]